MIKFEEYSKGEKFLNKLESENCAFKLLKENDRINDNIMQKFANENNLEIENIKDNILKMAKTFIEIMTSGKSKGQYPKDLIQEQLIKGIKIEKEHSNNEMVAEKIALDHLHEDKLYYDKIETLEL